MSNAAALSERGRIWFEALTAGGRVIDSGVRSIRVGDARLSNATPDNPAPGDAWSRFIAVVPNAQNRFPRARAGEVGLDEGWFLASQVRRTMDEDRDGARRPIVAIVDVSSQAYGRREELLGIHLACAAAADAYASARLAGHPLIALLVGKAMSGAFLAHGYQANRILAFDSPEVMVHAMGKRAAARVTRRSVAELEKLGETIMPMAYDIHSFGQLGLLHKLLTGVNADAPKSADVDLVRRELSAAIDDCRGSRDLSSRLSSLNAQKTRAASIEVRRRLAEQWGAGR
jgi:malonate decarboxylase gamma subunit